MRFFFQFKEFYFVTERSAANDRLGHSRLTHILLSNDSNTTLVLLSIARIAVYDFFFLSHCYVNVLFVLSEECLSIKCISQDTEIIKKIYQESI